MPEFVATHTPTLKDLDSFTRGYLEAAEFTDCHADNPELESATGFSTEFLASAKKDCEAFQESNADLLVIYYERLGFDPSYGGHDFWLTRNRHGAGFWDRYYGKDSVLQNACTELADAARAFGEIDLYAGDDGMIYGM